MVRGRGGEPFSAKHMRRRKRQKKSMTGLCGLAFVAEEARTNENPKKMEQNSIA